MSAGNQVSSPPASVLGIGAATPLGRDLREIARKLQEPPKSHTEVQSQNLREAALRVDVEGLWDPALSKQMRRADRFVRMAVMAAVDAWEASKPLCAGIAPERIGMIVSSGFGPHCRGFRFLDGILDNGDGAASPTDFSHSVHGAPSAYISGLLELRGPSMAVTDFEIGFEEVICLAQCWLNEGACDRVLIGAVEELGEVLLECAQRTLGGQPGIAPGEGAVYLMLGRADVAGIALVDATAEPAGVDLLVVETPTVPASDVAIASIVARQTVSFASHFGHSASATAFGVLGGLLSLQEGRALGRDVRQAAAVGYTIDSAATLRTSSEGRRAFVTMSRIGS